MKHLLDSPKKTLKLTIQGDILSTSIETLRPDIFGVLERVPPGPWEILVLDLTSATMVDSAGLNLLISVVRHLKNANVKIRALVTNENILRTFRFTRLDKHIELVES
jgi:anti-anti-sigma factor